MDNSAITEDAMANAEQSIEFTYIEAEGIRETVAGFNMSLGQNNTYLMDFNIEQSGELVKKLANKFLNQEQFDFIITEGNNTMSFKNAVTVAMYGFKSFSVSTETKPVAG